MKSILKFMTTICLCLNFACSEFAGPKKAPEPVAPNVPVRASAQLKEGESFTVLLEGLSLPNTFQARMVFHGDLSPGYIIQKTSPDKTVSTFTLDGSPELTDNNLVPGETYSYAIGINQDGEFIPANTVSIEVQPDFIVDGTLLDSNTTPLDLKNKFRIYFKKDSTLKTFGKNIEIDVQEIYSENGKLQTFSVNDTAPIYQAGTPSGRISLKAKKITGPFTIEIRGQKGGQGQKGATGSGGVQGPPSPIATLEVHWPPFSYTPDLCARRYYTPGNGRPCGNISYDECLLKHIGIGGKGGAGGQGFQGFVGLKGGDAENAFFEIPFPNENIKIIYEPGLGGSGGEPGDGGPGGPGGPGAPLINNSPGRPCDPSPQGLTGDQGPSGARGPEGTTGNKAHLSINGVIK